MLLSLGLQRVRHNLMTEHKHHLLHLKEIACHEIQHGILPLRLDLLFS